MQPTSAGKQKTIQSCPCSCSMPTRGHLYFFRVSGQSRFSSSLPPQQRIVNFLQAHFVNSEQNKLLFFYRSKSEILYTTMQTLYRFYRKTYRIMSCVAVLVRAGCVFVHRGSAQERHWPLLSGQTSLRCFGLEMKWILLN